MMTMIIAMMMSSLGGMMVIKNAEPRKQKSRKKFGPLFCIHQDGGIGVCQKMKKKKKETEKLWR